MTAYLSAQDPDVLSVRPYGQREVKPYLSFARLDATGAYGTLTLDSAGVASAPGDLFTSPPGGAPKRALEVELLGHFWRGYLMRPQTAGVPRVR